MIVSIILAAGEGTRMKSHLPKVLHKIAGRPMLSYVIHTCKKAQVDKNIVVVGHKSDLVREEFSDSDVVFVDQPFGEDVPYGTGFAVMQGIDEFSDEDTVVVMTGDTPLITEDTLIRFLQFHKNKNLACSVLTAIVEDPFGYGRIIRGESSNILKIVEEKDASDKEKAVNEVNSGIFAFSGKELKESLKLLDTDNSQGELYLTDVVKLLVSQDKKVRGFILKDKNEMYGVNSRVQLSICEELIRKRINTCHMEKGVTLINPENTIIEAGVEIGRDTIIYPGAILQGKTVIGKNCTIYGNTRIVDSTIEDCVTIDNVLIEESYVGEGAKLGPYARLRPKSKVGKNTKIGNFVEVKNSNIGDGSKAGHLAYIGDADVGENVNIGCGVIFVNYNGKEKFRTTVNDNAFIGSNSNLVAPVEVGESGYIAAGSTITKKVEKGQLSIERASQRNIDNWVSRKKLDK